MKVPFLWCMVHWKGSAGGQYIFSSLYSIYFFQLYVWICIFFFFFTNILARQQDLRLQSYILPDPSQKGHIWNYFCQLKIGNDQKIWRDKIQMYLMQEASLSLSAIAAVGENSTSLNAVALFFPLTHIHPSRRGQKTLTEVVSACGVTSGWTCRPSRAATQDSCKSRWWQYVSSLKVQEGLQAVVKPSFFSISAAFTFSKVYANENQRSTTCCRKVRPRTEINILEREAFARPQKCGGGV